MLLLAIFDRADLRFVKEVPKHADVWVFEAYSVEDAEEKFLSHIREKFDPALVVRVDGLCAVIRQPPIDLIELVVKQIVE